MSENEIHSSLRRMKCRKKKRPGVSGVSWVVCVSCVSWAAVTAQQLPPRGPDVHFAATPQRVVDAMLQLAGVTSRDVVYDLGSGDGRLVILAAQKYGARGVGIEIVHELVDRSRAIAREGEVADRVTFIEGDLFTADISQATVVTLWLTAAVSARLEPKLLRELRPGTRIVAHQFPIGTWAPEKTVRLDGEEIFLWTVPPR